MSGSTFPVPCFRLPLPAFGELGAEARYRLEVDAFPAVVIIDRRGRNFHEETRGRWRRFR